jgi:quinol monooxygenase YgiN
MRRVILLLLASVAYAGTMSLPANSQAPPAPPPVPEGPRYVVTYLEVPATATADGAKMVRQFRDAVRTEPGNLRAQALQRLGQPHQLVLLEAWQDQAAADTHAKASTTLRFHEQIRAIQNAPADVRVHFPLSVGPVDAVQSGAAVAIVTHVDVIPPQRENGTAIVKQLAEDSRKDGGNLRFEAVTQVNRQNHFTLIELWRDSQSAEAHSIAAHTRAFRERLAPASGALYDERLYSVLD